MESQMVKENDMGLKKGGDNMRDDNITKYMSTSPKGQIGK